MKMPSEPVLVKASYFTIFTADFLRGFSAIIEHGMGFLCVMRRNISFHVKLKDTLNQSFAIERLLSANSRCRLNENASSNDLLP